MILINFVGARLYEKGSERNRETERERESRSYYFALKVPSLEVNHSIFYFTYQMMADWLSKC